MLTNIEEYNKKIVEYMGYIYFAIVQEDFSDCGGLYEDTPIYSKVPIAYKSYSDGNWLEDNWWQDNRNDFIYDELKYHFSWNWLMKVVDKINSEINNFKIFNKGCQINAALIDVRDKETLFECVYFAVIKFIEHDKRN